MCGCASGFSEMIQFVDHMIPTDETFINGLGKQRQRFPILAVREVIANAMILQEMVVPSLKSLTIVLKHETWYSTN